MTSFLNSTQSTKGLETFIESLKNSSSTIHSNEDILNGIPNGILQTNQITELMLARIMGIGFITDYTKNPNYTFTTPEEAKDTQQINEAFIDIQLMMQQYCIQHLVVGNTIKSLIDDFFMSAPELKNIKSIDDLFEYYKKSYTGQSGGCCSSVFSFFIMGFILFLLALPSKSQNNQIALITPNNNPLITPNNNPLVLINNNNAIQLPRENDEKFTTNLQEFAMFSKSHMYTVEYNTDMLVLFNQILSLFATSPDNSTIKINKIINEFNENSRKTTDKIIERCKKLLTTDIKDNNIVLENWFNTSEQQENKKEIDSIKLKVEEYNKSRWFASGYRKKEISDYQKRLTEISVNETSEYKSLVKQNLYETWNFLCSNSYNLQLRLIDSNIEISGDKINYDDIFTKLNKISEVLIFSIEKFPDNQVLKSFNERLTILKEINLILKGSVMLMGLGNNINKANSISELETVLNKQLDEIIFRLNESDEFPISMRNISNFKKNSNALNDIEANKLEIEITNQNNNNIISARRSNQTRANLKATGERYGENINAVSGIVGDLAGNVISAPINIVSNTANKVFASILNGILDNLKGLLRSPLGIIICVVGVGVGVVVVGNPVNLIIKSGKMFCTIIKNGVLFVYQVVATPVGYVYNLVSATKVAGNPGGKNKTKRRKNINAKNKTKRRKNINTNNKTKRRKN